MLDLSKYTKELHNHFLSSENILLICHINPDGDAIGSQIALYQYLKATGHKVGMIAPNNLQEFLKWIDGVDQIMIYIKDRSGCRKLIKEADLIVMLDFNQSSRLGEAESVVLRSGARKVIIDHHLDPQNFADFTISDPTKCSTAELVYELVSIISKDKFMTRSYAEAVYAGIITDTGNFEHGSYTSKTFRIAADLLETGIDKSQILNLIYNNYSADRMRLQGYALNKRMVVMPEYRTAYIFLTREDLKSYNHSKGDTEGFVNMPLSIKGIDFAVLFVEKDGFIKLSFRSKGKFPSNVFASEYFNGGGHLNASGGEYFDTIDNTIQYFLEVLKDNKWRFHEGLQ